MFRKTPLKWLKPKPEAENVGSTSQASAKQKKKK